MITYETSLQLVLDCTRPLGKRTMRLAELLGHTLAAPLIAPFPLPRFNQSAMDGYAILASDFSSASPKSPLPLNVLETITAGNVAQTEWHRGFAYRIMTGAPLPACVDAVVMREEVEHTGQLRIVRPPAVGENVRYRGEEFAAGDVVLPAGTLVKPPVIGLLATFGFTRYPVHRPPKVSLIVTGDEVQSPGEALAASQIYDSNTPALLAALSAIGIHEVRARRCRDKPESLRHLLRTALQRADIIITVGGISVGDYDYVKSAVEGAGIETVFWKVAIKPGKPTYFGVARKGRTSRTLVFGLPGNPVAALVTFELFVKPAIRKMRGEPQPAPVFETALLTETLHKQPGRLEFVRGKTELVDSSRKVAPVRGQESHMLGGLANGDCLILFPQEADMLPVGATVSILPLHW